MSLTMISVVFFGCGPKEEPLPPTPPAPTTVSVTGVSLNKTSLSLVEGGSESLTATVSPDNATNKAVSWKSSDTGVATVDGSGKVTAVKAGSTTITVTTTDGGKTATCSVTVTSKTVSVTGVKLDNGKLELKAGETAQLTATVEPSDASDKSLEWTSSDAKVATVDASGKVTAVGVGSATITVKTKDGGKTATCAVTVAPVAVEGVTVDPAKAEVVEGNTVQLKATVSPADANQEVEWTSSDSEIATVDKNGLVTSIKPGTVYIVVRSKAYTDKQASCEVIVKQDDKLKSIAFDASELQIETGQSRTLKVIFTPDYSANKNVSWSSSDPSVASVKDGNVIGVKEGTATITATSEDGGHKAECVVTVSKASGPQVFATTKNWSLLINGDLDPREGTFDVTKYLKSSSICDIAVRNGNVAVVATKSGNTSISVVMVKEGQKYVDSFDIPGEGSQFYSPTLAIAPNGDINIAAREKDAFWNDHLVWFKYNPVSGQFSFQRLDTAESGQIGATNSGDVYILSYKDTDAYTGYLFKNGKFDQNIDSSESNFYCQLFCAGNDVYTAVIDFPGKKVIIRKNGKSYQTVKLDMVSIFPGDNAFWVTSNGDTYVCVEGHTATNDSRIYKNGKLLYKSNGFKNICVVEE